MSLLKDAGVPTPRFGLAKTAAEARKIAEDLGTKDLVIKAQVYSTNGHRSFVDFNFFSSRSWLEAEERASFPSILREVYNYFLARMKLKQQPRA